MSLLDTNFIEISLYYKYEDTDYGKRLVILDDDKGRAQMAKNDPDNKVEELKTKWALLTWEEQNEVSNLSSQAVNPQTGERQFSFLAYRDSVVKKCLKGWNLTVNEKPVPVTIDAVNKLPGAVVSDLYGKFEKLIDYSETELKN